MKNLFYAITLILSINVYGQDGFENAKVFVRVYDLQGKKIQKGKILSISDKSLQLLRKGESMNILVSSIGSIKTKHSAGNNFLIGAVSGASILGILGAATADPDAWVFGYSAVEGAALGVLLGGIAGTIIGGITIPFKNPKSYIINGDELKWKVFKEGMTGMQ